MKLITIMICKLIMIDLSNVQNLHNFTEIYFMM